MTDIEHIPEPLRPLWRPFLTTVALFVVSMTCFSLAHDVRLPPAPADLKVFRVPLDTVSHSFRSVGEGNRRRSDVWISSATSEEWPGFIFVFSGTSFFIEPPVTLDLYLDQNVEKPATSRKQVPNSLREVRVYGIATDAGIVLDPANAYQMRLKEKKRQTLFAGISLTLAVAACAFVVWRARLIFR
ncbi:hypothetical protein NIBR502774_14240 (plasmid) [Rhizobium sp. NIBRBAC000502774]|nr:hypothetical protein NIBR502774_14240 [Rhizobium sp. NIBRBAC000502774]